MTDEPIYQLQPGLKRCAYILRNGEQCQLADGHFGRHAWEQSWVDRVADVERQTAEADDIGVILREFAREVDEDDEE